MPVPLLVVHIALYAIGILVVIGVLIRLARTGRWRNPLDGVPLPDHGPTLVAVVGILLAYLVIRVAAEALLLPEGNADMTIEPGSDVWHRAQAGQTLTGVLLSVYMIVLLRVSRPRGPQPHGGPGPVAGLGAAVLGLLALLPIAAVQMEMGRVVWTWVRGDVTPPVHVVLEAIGGNAWGVFGIAHLLVGAVVVAPLLEELFFRGVLLQALCLHLERGWLAILLSGVAFGLVHSQPQHVLPLATMGILLGYLRLRCRSVWPCIVLHMLFNLRTMVFVLAAPEVLQSG